MKGLYKMCRTSSHLYYCQRYPCINAANLAKWYIFNPSPKVQWQKTLCWPNRWKHHIASSLYKCSDTTTIKVLDNSQDKMSQLTTPEKVVQKLPFGLQPYLRLMRLDKPTGMLLLLWPCYWSLAMGSPPGCFPDPSWLAFFGCGALLMRGAGCTINDLWDKSIDSKVARTKNRPLASGEIGTLDAWMFLGGQLSLALLLLLQANWYSIVLASSSLVLVVLYPLVKRVSYWPQLMLGFTFNWGAFLGWSVQHGSCDWSVVLPLYSACIFWTLIYDTIYAHQDRVDDAIVNVKSTALKFGHNTKTWLSSFASTSVLCFLLSGYAAGQTWPYYLSIGAASTLFATQISSLNINDPQDCWKKFKSNHKVGWIIFSGIVGGTLFKVQKDRKDEDSTNRLTAEPD